MPKRDPVFKELDFESSPFGPTPGSGVYAVIIVKYDRKLFMYGSTQRVVYIGSSINIQKRVLNPSHIYRRLYNVLKGYSVYVAYKETKRFQLEEIRLIKKYRPRFNTQHA